jgi:hypothetical protein
MQLVNTLLSVLRNAVLVLLLSLFAAESLLAVEFSNLGKTPVFRLFFIANGYYYGTQADEQSRKKATRSAMQFALAKTRNYLEERGLGATDYLITQLTPETPIRILSSESIDSGFQGENLVGVRVIGEIRYEIADKVVVTPADILQVDIASDRNRYQEGEHLFFMMRGNKQFYGSLLDHNPGGEMIQLLPNGLRPGSRFNAATRYLFPDKKMGDNFDLEVGAPFGKDSIRIIASDTPIGSIIEQQTYGSGIGSVSQGWDWVATKLDKQVIAHLKKSRPHETFRVIQVFENSLELTTFGSAN